MIELVVLIRVLELLEAISKLDFQRTDEGNVHRRGHKRDPDFTKEGIDFLFRLGVRRLVKAELIASGLHWIRHRVLPQLAVLITNSDINTTVPEIREEVGVELDVRQPVGLVEERVTEIRGALSGRLRYRTPGSSR